MKRKELRHRVSGYRTAGGRHKMSAPEGRVPVVSHSVQHMPSLGAPSYLRKDTNGLRIRVY